MRDKVEVEGLKLENVSLLKSSLKRSTTGPLPGETAWPKEKSYFVSISNWEGVGMCLATKGCNGEGEVEGAIEEWIINF